VQQVEDGEDPGASPYSTGSVCSKVEGPDSEGDKGISPLILEKGYRCKFDGCGRYYTTLHHLRVGGNES